MRTIIDLPIILSSLSKENKELFDRFYVVEQKSGFLKFNPAMIPWVDKTFGDHTKLEHQKIISTFNKFTFEGALFNEVRASRPMSSNTDEDAKKTIRESVGDPFCDVKKNTPTDEANRIKGKYCTAQSNIAKFDGHHGLIVFNKHDPLNFTRNEVEDYFLTAREWVVKIHKKDKEAKYTYILWNCLWKAGASMIHGHMQAVLTGTRHYPEAELYNHLRIAYSSNFNSSYFDDLYKVHEAIGLGVQKKKVKVFMNITPKKEKEITIIGHSFDKEFFDAVYESLSCLRDEFGVQAFNMGMILPPFGEKYGLFKKEILEEHWVGFPIVARIVDRGKLSNKSSDLAGMELYSGAKVIESDPYKVFEFLKKRFEK